MDDGARQAEFEALLEPVLGSAYGLARNLTGNAHDAEDLVQEAALLAYRGFGGFESGTNFKAWFLRILTNRHISRHRKQARRPSEVDVDDIPQLYMFARAKEYGLHTRSEDPAALLVGKMGVEEVREAIASLPEEFRGVASLFLEEELSYQEISEMLDIPVGTVRSRLHRARRLLQRSLWHLAEERGIVRELATEGTSS